MIIRTSLGDIDHAAVLRATCSWDEEMVALAQEKERLAAKYAAEDGDGDGDGDSSEAGR